MTYRETFDDGAGGWFGWDQSGMTPLEVRDNAIVARGPWWVDYNHAPPGAGYLHILFALYTKDDALSRPVAGTNRLIASRCPTNFTDAKLTFRLRGEMEMKGSQLLLLAQSQVGDRAINSVLTAQPLRVTSDWTEQTITCAADNGQWTCLGSRVSAMDRYGWGPIAPVLKDLNLDIILVLFPLDVVPAAPVAGDMHLRRAGRDYPIDASRLPSGYVMLDEVRIEYP
jgi:hypothetical protein